MKRKTNLFYTTGPDSKFITFSNYTESLTGNFLSTDTKLFPSRFIVLYIKGLNKNTKAAFIKYLADYYESKLAVLRDYFSSNKKDIEKSVSPLNYLLEALLRIKEIKEDKIEYDHSVCNQFSKVENFNNEITGTNIIKFKYISDITEQDYNGTFTDTICNIDLRKFAYISSVELTSDFDDNVVQYDMPTTLYGWENNIPSEYINERSIPDSVGGINLDIYTDTTNINHEEHDINPNNSSTNSNNTNSNNNYDTYDFVGVGNFDNIIGVSDITPQVDANIPVEYIINDKLDNVLNINTSEIQVESNNSQKIIKISDVINDIMLNNNISNYAEGLSNIMSSTSSEAMSIHNYVDSLLTNNNNVYFYSNNASNVIYQYNGSSITTIDMTKNNEYRIDPEIIKLNINTSSDTQLEFNCIIPLYDIVNINYKSNFNTVERLIQTNGTGEIDLTPSSTNKLYCTNIPLGMWLYSEGNVNDENTTSIKLYKDTESGFSQSWSLTISSQFKPFPYSSKMPSELTTNSNTNAYATFAQVLASQSAMIDNFNKLSKNIANMNDHIRNIESQLANLGTSYNIDNIHREFNNFEIEMNNKFNVLKDDVINQMSYLKWHTTI